MQREREPHTVRRPKGSSLPSRYLCLAVEHLPGQGAVYAAVAPVYWGEGQAAAADPQLKIPLHFFPYLEAFCRRGTCTWLIGHRIYEGLTSLGFWKEIDEGRWQLVRRGNEQVGQIVHEPGCTYIVCVRKDGGRLIAVDVENYGIGPCAFGTGSAMDKCGGLALWWVDWLRWLHDNDAGSLQMTLAGQGYYCYRRRFMHNDIVIHDNKAALDLEDRALHGGRCEAFRIGKVPGPVYHLDANSLYGALAATHYIPRALVSYSEGGGAVSTEITGFGVADVTLDLPVPMVPWRDRQSKITIYPTGEFRTQLCAPELTLVAPYVKKVHALACYEAADLFGDWARWCWERRQWELNGGSALISKQLKLLSQVVYGRLAQRWRAWRWNPAGRVREPWEFYWSWNEEKQDAQAHRVVAGRSEIFEDGGFSPQACPVITAWINSLARVWLWNLMCDAGRENVVYCDTDSVIVTQSGFERLLRGDAFAPHSLGGLREIGCHSTCEILGIKHYVLDGKVTCAGMPAIGRDGVIDSIAGECAEPVTVACAAGRSPRTARAVNGYRRQGAYKHGKVRPDGQVVPWKLP